MRKIWITLLIALALLCALPAFAAQSDTVTRQCSLKVSAGKTALLTDGKLSTAWSPSGKNAKLLVTLPESGAGWLYFAWGGAPGAFTLTQYDADEKPLNTAEQKDGGYALNQAFALSAEARFVLLTLQDSGQSVCELRVYSMGDLPGDVQMWSSPLVNCDLMLIAAHPGDEYACFGGLLTDLTGEQGRSVQTLYMTNDGRDALEAALNGQWGLGLRASPICLNGSAKAADSAQELLKLWGGKDKLLGAVVEQIRRCRPKVIVSHSLEGEGGDVRRALTALAAQYAVEAAADSEQYPDSAQKYGVWQVQKLYLNLFGETQTVFDWTENEAPLLTMKTAFGASFSPSGEGESARLGLAYTAVGDDRERTDLFENLPGYSTVKAEPTPAPTREPAAPVIVFEPDPTPDPTPQPGSAAIFGENAVKILKIAGLALLAIALITVSQVLIYRFHHRKRR